MNIRDLFRNAVYDWLAGRRPSHWRALYEVDFRNINRVGLYHVNGKLGDTVYLILLALEIRRQRNWEVRAFTTATLAPMWRALCPAAEVVEFDSERSLSVRWRRLKIARRQAGEIDLLITLDYGEDFQSLLELRSMRALHRLAPGKEVFSFFDLTIPDGAYTSLKRSTLTRVIDALSVVGLSFNKPVAAKKSNGPVRFLINAYGASDARSFTEWQVVEVVGFLRAYDDLKTSEIILSVPEPFRKIYIERLKEAGVIACVMPPIDTGRLVDLVRTIDFCITPDTGIAHLAGMLGVRTLVFYAAQRFEPVVWKPDFDHVEINVPPRYRPLPTIPLDELIGAIDDFLKKRLFA